MPRLFGTDGIRGVANVDLKPTLAYALGRATAHRLARPGGAIVVGQDTRRSGDMFVAAITAGATSLGVDVHVVGVVPTPALAYLARTGAVRGRDHGLGLAQPGRRQRPQGARRRRAQARRRDRGRARAAHLARGRARRGRQRAARPAGRRRAARSRRYASIGAALAARHRRHRRCASSSTARTARAAASGREILARDRRARSRPSTSSPDGVNINVRCGATDPASLAEAVVARGADVGFALDGDADRLIAVDAAGRVVDGDQVLGILALDRLARGALPGGLVVSVLSNGGLQAVVEAAGGEVIRTPGRRQVHPRGDAGVRGDASVARSRGHVIVLEHTTSGDGIVTALEVLRVMAARGAPPGRPGRRRSRSCPSSSAPCGPATRTSGRAIRS